MGQVATSLVILLVLVRFFVDEINDVATTVGIQALVLSLILCYTYRRTGSVVPGIVAHGVNNSTGPGVLGEASNGIGVRGTSRVDSGTRDCQASTTNAASVVRSSHVKITAEG